MDTRRVGLVALMGALVAAACTGGGGGGGGGATVKATLSEYAIKVEPATTGAGSVTFDITNAGAQVHEFLVLKTDLAEDRLPVSGDKVEEDAPGITLVGEKEGIGPGDHPTLTVTLQPGHYVLICNITGHYSQGMHASFTVP